LQNNKRLVLSHIILAELLYTTFSISYWAQ